MDTLHWISDAEISALAKAGTDAYRAAWKRGALVEVFADAVLISVEGVADATVFIEEVCVRLPATKAIYVRCLVKNPTASNAPVLAWGSAVSPRCLVRESGLIYEIDFAAGYSCGLFLDQRENRLHLRSLRPQRVLNTYSFTCSFSVAATAVGAQTINIDIAKQALARGKHNFFLNGFDIENHRFYADDTFAVLRRLARWQETFDAIILDPPTFSRNRAGKVFRVEHDMPSLLEATLPCLADNGSILLSTNNRSLDSFALEDIARSVCGINTKCTIPPHPDGMSVSSTLWITPSTS